MNDYQFVGSIEVRNIRTNHTFTDDELLRLLRIAGLAYDGSRLKLTAKEIEYVCLLVRFNHAKQCKADDRSFDRAAFNHLQILRR
jgi:hypothetical protein